MYEISSRDDYLQITFRTDVDYPQILLAVEELLSREDYANRDDIWIFDTNKVDISFEQLEIIAQALMNKYPTRAVRSKTAMVAVSGFQSAIVSEFIEVAGFLPYELRLFHSLREAEGWILQPAP